MSRLLQRYNVHVLRTIEQPAIRGGYRRRLAGLLIAAALGDFDDVTCAARRDIVPPRDRRLSHDPCSGRLIGKPLDQTVQCEYCSHCSILLSVWLRVVRAGITHRFGLSARAHGRSIAALSDVCNRDCMRRLARALLDHVPMCVCGVTCYTCYYANMLCLDLFCGEGGAAMGYHKAGFEVIGVDKYAQPRYPFEFKRMDAFKALENTHGIDLIHASPPCQSYSKQVAHWAHEQPRYIEELRKILKELAIPYIIEQPPSWGALHNPVTLCGSMFGLRIRHHREFESNLPLQLTLK